MLEEIEEGSQEGEELFVKFITKQDIQLYNAFTNLTCPITTQPLYHNYIQTNPTPYHFP